MAHGEVLIHPIYDQAFTCSEHPEGQYMYIGDMLGVDCMVEKFVDGWMRTYKNDGKRNEDWYGWGCDVLAPFAGTVESIHINPFTNEPGSIREGRAGSITFAREDGVRIVYAHVMDVSVEVGDRVQAGDRVAKVGNNGFSRCPHIHVGAWIDKTPLQIRFDLSAMGRQLREKGERGYFMTADTEVQA